ncbi:trimethylamine N-oxide reductase I catalytic subunit [Helicobacter sp. 13S00482-2]|uniref:trimethylamine-N-oxide reductase TorA n=1 Tax=Helicobacter sp. 13S00482-2 TaxID=1476200 RepID=UPI000BA5DCF6|nr:trimethylamine-N-oxide reductase TorA [Helicobacter sp. 13S00482-2]PAF53986.1 trimethylamine N-oxide reductase I catalytic subunit [Helicobacter sp. 13S00482-2]
MKKISEENSKQFALSRRKLLKYSIICASLPFADSILGRNLLFAQDVKKFSQSLVLNGDIITAAHWGAIKVTLKDGKIIKSQNVFKQTMANPLQNVIADLVYAKDRIKYPMVRKSYLENPDNPKTHLRGSDEWVRVSYKDAIKLISKELKKTREKKGSEGVFAGSYGWKSSGNMHNSRILLQRFMGMSGGFVGTTGDYSTGASQVIMPHVLGTIEVYEQQTSWPVVIENSEVVVIWGANPLLTLRIAWTSSDGKGLEYLKALKDSKKQIICIDPIRNETAKFLNARWIAPIPNTDVALMLGIAHSMFVQGMYSKEFIQDYTEGFLEFEEYLLGKKDHQPKDAKWASTITGVPEKTIKELAELFYKHRTMLISGWGMQRAHHGEQTHWMLATLACMIGQIGLPGGGMGLSYHYSNGGSPSAKSAIIGGMNLGDKGSKAESGASWLLKGTNLNFPVARIADALLNPGKTIDFNGKKITYTDIDFIYWVGGNPIVHHQNTNELLKAWRKPRTIVVHDMFWTPTAKYADIVMPITTSYERDDITMSGDYSNLSIIPMKAAVKPQFEAKSDYEIFCDLAKEFGIYQKYSENKTPMEWIQRFYESALAQAKGQKIQMPNFEKFWQKNTPITFEIPQENEEWVRYADYREDPILNPLGTPSGKIEIYSKEIEKMKYQDCPPHPTWLEPIEWLGMKNKPAEFAMISPHPGDRLHSQLSNTSLRKTYAIADREPIWINTQDAKKKGIKTGDIVRVYNQRGQVLAGAYVTDDIAKGVVRLSEGAWYDPIDPSKIGSLCKNGCANVLTIDIPTSKLADGNIAHTALVNIEKFKGKIPKLTAFDNPKGA